MKIAVYKRSQEPGYSVVECTGDMFYEQTTLTRTRTLVGAVVWAKIFSKTRPKYHSNRLFQWEV